MKRIGFSLRTKAMVAAAAALTAAALYKEDWQLAIVSALLTAALYTLGRTACHLMEGVGFMKFQHGLIDSQRLLIAEQGSLILRWIAEYHKVLNDRDKLQRELELEKAKASVAKVVRDGQR